MAGSTFTGDQIIAMQAQVAAATARTGGTPFWNGGKSETRSYIHASYIDDVVAMKRTTDAGSATYFVHSNSLYSPQVLMDSSGAAVEKYTYDAYGKQTVKNVVGTAVAGSTVKFGRGFTGYIFDPETGLYCARERMYSPGMGRFLSRDPWRKTIGNPKSGEGYSDGMNLYRAYFVPDRVDPTGMNIWDLIQKELGNKVPKMMGIDLSGSVVANFGVTGGAQAAFFPDSCEIGIYLITNAILDPGEKAKLEKSTVGERIYRALIDTPFGLDLSFSLNGTLAYHTRGDPGSANADSWSGVFYGGTAGGELVGAGAFWDPTGTWIGGSVGVGLSATPVSVKTNPQTYFLVYKQKVSRCVCLAMTEAMP